MLPHLGDGVNQGIDSVGGDILQRQLELLTATEFSKDGQQLQDVLLALVLVGFGGGYILDPALDGLLLAPWPRG